MRSGKRYLFILIWLVVWFCQPGLVGRAGESQKTFFKVKLSCGSCVIRINTALKAIDGYTGMTAHVDRDLVAVNHTADLPAGRVIKAVTAAGYPAQLAPASEYDPNEDLSAESSGWRDPNTGIIMKLLGFLF